MTVKDQLFAYSSNAELGEEAHNLASELWPINRSLSGPGVRETIDILKRELPNLKSHRIASGEHVFDWTVPDEWSCRSATLTDPDGHIVCDIAENNLHLVGYSIPMQSQISLDGLQAHLHSLPDQPDAIPYVTAYYTETWGFCLSHKVREKLKPGDYTVDIQTTRGSGHIDYADLIIPGQTDQEILFSTYICHPSMANNELSGPVVAQALAKIVQANQDNYYTYRFVFVPETIGAIVYLSRNLDHMKSHTKAGFQLSCVGDERTWSYIPSRWGNTLSDQTVLTVMTQQKINYDEYSFLQRGSDERQYCAPGIDLPVCSVTRSKYGTYPEYHTSLDDLTFVTAKGLGETIGFYRDVIRFLETNKTPRSTVLGEPQLGKRGLYSNISKVDHAIDARLLADFLAYSDGSNDLYALAEILGRDYWQLVDVYKILHQHDLIENC